MISSGAVPFLLIIALLMPLPLFFCSYLFAVLLAVRPRGEPRAVRALIPVPAGPAFLRGPPV